MENLGRSIRSLRELEGLSLSELGRKIGRTRQAVSAYERGVIRPSIETLERLAAVFNISVAELVYDGEAFSVSEKITEDEYALLRYFRAMSPRFRYLLLQSAAAYADGGSAKNNQVSEVV